MTLCGYFAFDKDKREKSHPTVLRDNDTGTYSSDGKKGKTYMD